jgi:C-terminal processing protease CtpA/Prc
MDVKTVEFGEGALGIQMKGSALGIQIIGVDMDSEAMKGGVKVGDFIVGIDGKPLTEELKSLRAAGDLVKYVGGLTRPLKFHFNGE